MDFAAKKKWHEQHTGAQFHEADLALLKSKTGNDRQARRIAVKNQSAILWHLLTKDLATPDEILANRKQFGVKPANKPAPTPESVSHKVKEAAKEAKKKVSNMFNKNKGQGQSKSTKNTHK